MLISWFQDNYQGEESEVVIASLTRSNKQGDIGFMAAPERLNVLLSRARDVLIIVGNSETFLASRKGKKCWGPLLNQMKSDRHIYSGLPIRCEQHPQTSMVIETPADFDRECPDGGCAAPWYDELLTTKIFYVVLMVSKQRRELELWSA